MGLLNALNYEYKYIKPNDTFNPLVYNVKFGTLYMMTKVQKITTLSVNFVFR